MPFLHPAFEQPPIRHVQLAMPCVLPSPYSVGASTQTPGSGAPGGHQPDQGRTQPGSDSQRTQTALKNLIALLDSDGPDPDLMHMGYAQRMVLLDQVMDSTTQVLATQFSMDAKSMALTLSKTQNRWVMSIGTSVVLR